MRAKLSDVIPSQKGLIFSTPPIIGQNCKISIRFIKNVILFYVSEAWKVLGSGEKHTALVIYDPQRWWNGTTFVHQEHTVCYGTKHPLIAQWIGHWRIISDAVFNLGIQNRSQSNLRKEKSQKISRLIPDSIMKPLCILWLCRGWNSGSSELRESWK